MPCEMKPRFVLLYGSQKGQAQAIAEGVAEEAETHGLVAELSCLENNENVTIEIVLCVFRCRSDGLLVKEFSVNYCNYG